MGCKHSHNMTLSVVSVDKLGEKLRKSVLKTLILSVKNIQGRYPNLKKPLYLLPFALADRIENIRKKFLLPKVIEAVLLKRLILEMSGLSCGSSMGLLRNNVTGSVQLLHWANFDEGISCPEVR